VTRKTRWTRDISCTSMGTSPRGGVCRRSGCLFVTPQRRRRTAALEWIETIVGERFYESIDLWLYAFRLMDER
jgi:hypothetical protein